MSSVTRYLGLFLVCVALVTLSGCPLLFGGNQPPSVSSFAINDGAATTEYREVELHNVAFEPTHYVASELPDFSDTDWWAYSEIPSFTLSAGAGIKTVYFKVKNYRGESEVVSDTIRLLGPAEGEGESVTEGEIILEGEGEGEVILEGEGESVTEGEAIPEGEGEGAVILEGEGESVTEGEAIPEGEGEGEVVLEGEGEILLEGEGEVLVEGEIGGQPDLVVSHLYVDSWVLHTSISYSYEITNIGTAPANLDGPTDVNNDNVSVQAFLSSDSVFNNAGDLGAGGSIVGISPAGLLLPGETKSGVFDASCDVDPAVNPYLLLKVDWGGSVDESNENNNVLLALVSAAGEGEGEAKPDLVVSYLHVDSYVPHASISYSYEITNIGTAPANLEGLTDASNDNVAVQAFLSSDTILDYPGDHGAGGTVVGLSPLGPLQPGEIKAGSFSASCDVDPTVNPYLVLMVDWGAVVDESDETNNTASATI